MLLKTLRENFHNALKDIYPDPEIQSFFKILAECFLKMKGVDIALNLYMPMSGKKIEKFEHAIKRLKKQEPIQYIIGVTEFYGLPFKVTESTLIPRPETEELVHWTLESSQCKNEALTILDIGTGTGCIAIALAKNLPNAKIYAIDLSTKALTIAKTNAKLNSVSVEFVELDILNWETNLEDFQFKDLTFDIIVSNPPYVRTLEKIQMSANVLNYEPDLALYVDDTDPLIFYKKIAAFANTFLKNDGQLFFEINQYLGTDMIDLLKRLDYQEIELRKDIFENDRMVTALKSRHV